MSEAPERIWIEDEFGDDGYPHLSLEAADRIEQLTAQNLRLSGLCYDLKKEVAISDALLISEAEVSLERLARAEAAEAERDRLREALTELLQVFDGVPMLGIEASRRGEAARAALKGETP